MLNDAKNFELEVSLNYKFATIAAQNGDIDWKVVPLDALAFYRIPNWRFGGGLTYHMNPSLKGSGVAGGLQADYKDALGFVLQGDFMFGQKIKLGLRYTAVQYKAETIKTSPSLVVNSQPPSTANTNAIGLVFSMSFF